MGRTHEIRLAVPAHPSSLGVVRRAADGLCELCGEDTAQRLTLIFSELVTNSIRHAGIDKDARLEVVVTVDDDRIHGYVTDPGRGFDPALVPERDPAKEGGFGLHIVDELATRWGVERSRGMTVWFEI